MLKEILLKAVIAFAGEQIPEQFIIGEYIQPVEIYQLSAGEVNVICQDHAIKDPTSATNARIAGCVIFADNKSLVHWDRRYEAHSCIVFISTVDVLLHELAHCKGWPPNHPR